MLNQRSYALDTLDENDTAGLNFLFNEPAKYSTSDTILGSALSVAQIGSGIFITVFSGGLGAAIGSSLISSGINSGMTVANSAYNGEKLDWGKYQKDVVKGAITGLVTAGTGAAIGAVGNAATKKATEAALKKLTVEAIKKATGEGAKKVSEATAKKMSEELIKRFGAETAKKIGEEALGVTRMLGIKAVTSAATATSGNIVSGVVESVIEKDSKHIKERMTTSNMVTSVVSGLVSTGVSHAASKGTEKASKKIAEKVFGESKQYSDTLKDTLTVVTGVTSGATSGAASAAATNVTGNVIKKVIADESKDEIKNDSTLTEKEWWLTKGMGEAMYNAALSGAINGAATSGKIVREERYERKKNQELLKIIEKEEKLDIAIQDDEESIHAEKEKLKQSLQIAEEQELLKQETKKDLDSANDEMQQSIENQKKLNQFNEEQLQAQKNLEAEIFLVKQESEEFDANKIKNQQELDQITSKKQQIDNKLQLEEQAIKNLEAAKVEAEKTILAKQKALEASTKRLAQQEAEEKQQIQAKQDADNKLQELKLAAKSKEQEINNSKKEKKLNKIGNNISKVGKKAWKNARKIRSEALDSIGTALGGPLQEDFNKIRRELAAAEETVRELGKKVDQSISNSLKPLRNARDQANKEFNKAIEQANEAGRNIDKYVSGKVKPLRDLRNDIDQEYNNASERLKTVTKNVDNFISEKLNPALQKRDEINNKITEGNEQFKKMANKIDSHQEKILRPLKESYSNIVKSAEQATNQTKQVANDLSKKIEVLVPTKELQKQTQIAVTDAKNQFQQANKNVSNAIKQQNDSFNNAIRNQAELNKLAREVKRETKSATNKFQKVIVDPITQGLKDGTQAISDETRPLIKPIEEKLAPLLQKGVEHIIRAGTVPIESTIKQGASLAGIFGNKAIENNLNKQSDNISKSSKTIAKSAAKMSGNIVTAKNAAKIGATVGGTILGGPVGGAAALSVVQSAQGETVTGKDIAINVVSSYAAGAASSSVTNIGGTAIVSGAANGATRNGTAYILKKLTADNPENRNINGGELIKELISGAASGAVSIGASNILDSEASLAGNAITSGATSMAVNAVDQYQRTGTINAEEVLISGTNGAMQSLFSDIVDTGTKNAFSPEKPNISATNTKATTSEIIVPEEVSSSSDNIEPTSKVKSISLKDKEKTVNLNSSEVSEKLTTNKTEPKKDETPPWAETDRKGRYQPNPFPQGKEDLHDVIQQKGLPNKKHATLASQALETITEEKIATGKIRQDKKNYKKSYAEVARKNQNNNMVRFNEPQSKKFGMFDALGVIIEVIEQPEKSKNSLIEVQKQAILSKFDCGNAPTPIIYEGDPLSCALKNYDNIHARLQERISKIKQITGEDFSQDVRKILWMPTQKREHMEIKIDKYIESKQVELEQRKYTCRNS